MNSKLVHGLLWREWLLHQGELRWVFAAWLLGVWVVPIHPGFFLLPFGVISALLLAPSFGGADAQEESEEFSFALPPTRSQRYLVRLGLGGGPLLAMLGLGLLAGALDLPQRVWGLFFESGFTASFGPMPYSFAAALSVAAPAAVFGEAFAAGSSSRNPTGMNYLWIRALFVVGMVLMGDFFVEGMLFRHPTGWIACPVLAGWAVIRLAWAYRDYRWKEGVSGLPRLTVQTRSGSRTWVVLLVILAVIVLLAVLFLFAGARPAPPQPVGY